MASAPRVAGVDGCRGGWIVAVLRAGRLERFTFAPSFEAVLERHAGCARIGVDIPIGLPERVPVGGRACEQEARALLGPRRSSVFPTPARAVLAAADYEAACELNRAHHERAKALSKQTWFIVDKIAEVDRVLRPELQREQVHEIHPELSFYALNEERPLDHSKKTTLGALTRLALLEAAGVCDMPTLRAAAGALRDTPGERAALDDLLDALAAGWSANRAAQGRARRLPEGADPPLDERGLRQELWF